MPPRPLKVCRHAGCHELTRDPSGYCPKHKDAAEARARKWKAEQDSQRESAYRRGYGARWRKLRAQILMDEPLCRECRKAGRIVPATDVDHIVDSARFMDRQLFSTLSAMRRICIGVRRSASSTTLLALVTAEMIFMISKTASEPFRLMIFMLVSPFLCPVVGD